MGHYRSNVRDLEFNLFEVLELEKALASGEFGDLDAESVREMLDEAGPPAGDPGEIFARWMARDDALARLRAERAAALGLPVVAVDGSRTVEETTALIGRQFGLEP